MWLGELTVPAMPIAVDLGRKATKKKKKKTPECIIWQNDNAAFH